MICIILLYAYINIIRVMKGIVHGLIPGEPETLVAVKMLKGNILLKIYGSNYYINILLACTTAII